MTTFSIPQPFSNQNRPFEYNWWYWIEIHNIKFGFHTRGISFDAITFSVTDPKHLAALSDALNLYQDIAWAIDLQEEILRHTTSQVEHVYNMRPRELIELESLRVKAVSFLSIPKNSAVDPAQLIEAIDEFAAKLQAYQPPLTSIRRTKVRKGFIYLVKGVGGYYKIGRTVSIEDRMKAFGVKLPFNVELEHVIKSDDYIEAERKLHRQYASKRTNGEWFALTAADVADIKSIEGM